MVKTKRVIFKRAGEVSLEEVELPDPSENQILVKTSTSLISIGTELTAFSGNFPPHSHWAEYIKYPFIAGYCNAGLILEKGGNVREFEVGDRVASMASHSQYVIVDAEGPVKIPKGVSDEGAAFHGVVKTAMNSVRLAKISMGESVVVIGAGLLGQFAIMFSKLVGGYPIISVDLSEKRIELAKKSGATHIVKSDVEDVEKKVRSITDGRMADVVFEVTGSPTVIPWAIKLVKPQGKFIILSSPRGPTLLDFHDEVNFASRIIIGTHASSHPKYETPYNQWTMERNTKLYFKFLEAGIINVNHLITHRYPWFEAEKAYKMLMEKGTEALGVIFDFKRL